MHACAAHQRHKQNRSPVLSRKLASSLWQRPGKLRTFCRPLASTLMLTSRRTGSLANHRLLVVVICIRIPLLPDSLIIAVLWGQLALTPVSARMQESSVSIACTPNQNNTSACSSHRKILGPACRPPARPSRAKLRTMQALIAHTQTAWTTARHRQC